MKRKVDEMMFDYLNDGADHQSRAVLMLLQGMNNIESSWNSEYKEYDAKPKISRWENGREQGYCIRLVSSSRNEQINIVFFEHRNSDNICCFHWTSGFTMNSPTIETLPNGVFDNKYDYQFSVSYGEIEKMADYIRERMEEFWTSN